MCKSEMVKIGFRVQMDQAMMQSWTAQFVNCWTWRTGSRCSGWEQTPIDNKQRGHAMAKSCFVNKNIYFYYAQKVCQLTRIKEINGISVANAIDHGIPYCVFSDIFYLVSGDR